MAAPSHAFDRGDIVTVFNRTMSGRSMIEGRARVVKRLDEPHHYAVQFRVGAVFDRQTFERFVFPGDCQSDPEAYLRSLLEAEAA